jgi:hypothetical protein
MPAGTRVIARPEVPQTPAQLWPVECNGRRITCFATTPVGAENARNLKITKDRG